MFKRTLSLLSGCLLAMSVGRVQAAPVNMETLSVTDGLGNNSVYAIVQDTLGYIWFGTVNGLDRYDGKTFCHYELQRSENAQQSGSLQVNCLLSCSDGELLVGTVNGLHGYLRSRDMVVPYEPAAQLKRIGIRSLAQDGELIWIGTNRGLYCLDRSTGELAHYNVRNSGLVHNVVRTIFVSGNYLYVGTFDGVSRLDKRTNTWKNAILKPDFIRRPQNNLVLSMLGSPFDSNVLLVGTQTGLCELNKESMDYELHEKSHDQSMTNNTIKTMCSVGGNVWMGTEEGVMIYDGRSFTAYGYNPSNRYSLPNNIVWSVFRDRDDIVWLGTDGGVGKYDAGIPAFDGVNLVGATGNPYVGISIFTAQVDRDGSLWFGSRFGLSHYDPSRNRMKWIDLPNSVPGTYNFTRALSLDSNDMLWVGTAEGVLCYDTRRNRSIVVQDRLRNCLKYINNIAIDKDGAVYVNDISGRLQIIRSEFDPVRRDFDVILDEMAAFEEFVSSMAVSRDYVWLGTWNNGLIRYRKSDGEVGRFRESDTPSSLSSNKVTSLYVDQITDKVWVGTNAGIDRYDADADAFRRIASDVVLSSVYTLHTDTQGVLWFTTQSNVGCYDEKSGKSNFFSLKHWMNVSNYRPSVAVSDAHDNVYILGLDGYVRMNHALIGQQRASSPLRMTGIRISDTSLYELGINRGRPVEELDEIELKYDQNNLAFQFAMMAYSSPSLIRYSYRLDGYDDDWKAVSGGIPYVEYQRLEPGDYTLRVKAVSGEGVPASNEIALSVRIAPPWWQTGWAYLVYSLVVMGCICLVYAYLAKRNAILAELNREKLEREKIEEINQVKLRFFTNVSHDFRTPLSLILSPVESLLEEETDPVKAGNLQIIRQNAQRLLRLVNQVLDFRKVEMQRMKLNIESADIVGLLRNISLTFSELAEKKGITFIFESGLDELVMDFDPDKIEKIFFNLISNALKFTEKDGSVIVNVRRKDTGDLEIMVADTGICIPKEDLPYIFERFYQVEKHSGLSTKGSGIGLTIVKEFVDMHGGKIQVMSKAGVGTTFFVTLPIVNEKQPDAEMAVEESVTPLRSVSDGLPRLSVEEKPDARQLLLLVEDNEDMRRYLETEFEKTYEVIACETAEAGWKIIRERMPDIVILDVMLPGMNGIELCKMVKNEFVTSHIPVILLTARTADEQMIEGFDAGADEYMPKPFNFRMLLKRIDNILMQRRRFRENLKRDTIDISPLEMQSPDQIFINKVLELIEQNMDDPDLDIPYLCDKLAVSHVNFYRKIKSITGMNVNMFIREVRLKKAAQMLRVKGVSVSDVMYDVGFNHRSYFSQCFKEMFGVTPKVYAQRYNPKDAE